MNIALTRNIKVIINMTMALAVDPIPVLDVSFMEKSQLLIWRKNNSRECRH